MQRTRFATQAPYPGVHASISAKPILTGAPGTAPIDGPHKNSGRRHALARRLGVARSMESCQVFGSWGKECSVSGERRTRVRVGLRTILTRR